MKILCYIIWIPIVFLCFTEVHIPDEKMDLSNLDTPNITINNKIPGKLKHKLGIRVIKEFIVLTPKTCSIKNGTSKEKGTKKENTGKHEDYYNALMYDKQRVVKECKIRKNG